MLALIPQSGDSSGAALGVRSVALLQVAKLQGNVYKVYSRNWIKIRFSPFISCRYHKIVVPLQRKRTS